MSVIPSDRAVELAWLADGHQLPDYQLLLQPYVSDAVREYVVDKRVSSQANNDAGVMLPAAG